MTRHSQDKGPEIAQALRGTITRSRPWGMRTDADVAYLVAEREHMFDETLKQMDASFRYELLRVLDNTELRRLCGRYGIDPSGYGRQQMIASILNYAEEG